MPQNRGAKIKMAKQEQNTINENGIIDNLVKWMQKNKKTLVSIAITAILVGAVFSVIEYLKNKDYQEQWSQLFVAELSVVNGGDSESYAPLETFAEQYKTKPAGVYASFVLGSALAQQEKFTEAEKYFKQALENANEEFSPLIMNSLASVYLATNKLDDTLNIIADFENKYSNHFSISQMKLYKGFALELKGNKQEAENIYRAILEDYPNTYYSAIAQIKLGIEPKAPEAPTQQVATPDNTTNTEDNQNNTETK